MNSLIIDRSEMKFGMPYALMVVAICLFGGCIRWIGLSRSLHHDELATVLLAEHRLDDLPEVRLAPLTIWATQLSTKVFGHSEFAARFPSFLVGTASLPLLGLLAWRQGGPAAAVIAVAIATAHPWHLYHTQEARYPIAVFFWTLMFLLALDYGRSNKYTLPVIMALCTIAVLGLLTNAMFVLLLLSLLVPPLFARYLPKLEAYSIPLAVLCAALTFLAVSLMIPSIASRFTFSPRTVASNAVRLGLYVSPFCLFLGLCFICQGWRRFAISRDSAAGLAVFGAIALIADMPFRYYGWLLPQIVVCASLFIATVVNRVRAGAAGAAIAATAVLFSFVPQLASYHLHEGHKPGARETVQFVLQRWQPGDRLVISETGIWMVQCYGPALLENTLRLEELTDSPRETGRYWMIYNTLTKPAEAEFRRRFPGAVIQEVFPTGTPFEPYANIVSCWDSSKRVGPGG